MVSVLTEDRQYAGIDCAEFAFLRHSVAFSSMIVLRLIYGCHVQLQEGGLFNVIR